MVMVKKAFKCLVPHYVLRESLSTCTCHIDDECECMPDLYLTQDGYSGYGSAFWTYADETCPEDVQDAGKAYYCKFCSVEPFWAMGETDAVEKYRELLDLNNVAANVNYQNNKKADAVLKSLNEEANKYK